ncbi:MAG: hypothetical protein ABR527_08730 [Gemmatimonadota bacterium]
MWTAVHDVSPIVAQAGFFHMSSDEADWTGYEIGPCAWDTVGLPPPDDNKERIRLRVRVVVQGGQDMRMTRLAYHLVAIGRLAPGESI